MNNTLLAVLVMAVCCEHAHAQDIPQRSPGYIKYQGTHPTKSVGKGSSAKHTTSDGAVTTDKLASDIFISNITADGTVTTDKLADDILNSMRAGNREVNSNTSVWQKLPALVSCNADIYRQLYASYMKQVVLQWQYAHTVSSMSKRTGWLQYKVD